MSGAGGRSRSAVMRKKGGPEAAWILTKILDLLFKLYFLLFRGLLLSEAGFHRCSDAGQHLLRGFSKLTRGLKFQIFIESFRSSVWRYHLVALQSRLSRQIHAFEVVGIGTGGIGGDGFVEGGNRIIHFADIGQHCPKVKVVHGSIGRIQLRRLRKSFCGLLALARPGVGIAEIVVIGGELFVGVWSLGSGFHSFLLQIDGLLIIGDCGLQALGSFRHVSLLRSRRPISIRQLEPQEISSGVGLCGFCQNLDRRLIIASCRCLRGSSKFLVQRLHCGRFFCRFFLLLLDLFLLLWTYALLLRSLGLFLLQVKVNRNFIQTHRNVSIVEQFFAVLQKRDGVFSGRNAQGKILTLVVGFYFVLAASFLARKLDHSSSDWFSFKILAHALYGARGLGKGWSCT